jgi:hypothetical protein
MRLPEFKADGLTIDMCDYSPTRKQRNESPHNKICSCGLRRSRVAGLKPYGGAEVRDQLDSSGDVGASSAVIVRTQRADEGIR